MTPRTHLTSAAALILCTVLPSWGQQYLLYTPQPVTSIQSASSQNGVLVQEIEIKKGDTLFGLSRKFNGRGMYFPQILLFNSIHNPDLIYAGKTLRIPLSQKDAHDSDLTERKGSGNVHKSAASKSIKRQEAPSPGDQSKDSTRQSSPSTELSLRDLKIEEPQQSKPARLKKKADMHAKKSAAHETPAATDSTTLPAAAYKSTEISPSAVDTAAGQKLFEAAVKSYRKDDCRTAIELLDRFLADNSGSPLAADATLYKAECYLKLSAQ